MNLKKEINKDEIESLIPHRKPLFTNRQIN